MTQAQARKIGVSFYPKTAAIVEQESERLGLYNFSAALRYIIHDWKSNQQKNAVGSATVTTS